MGCVEDGWNPAPPALDDQQVDSPAARGEAEQTETDGQIDSGEHD